MKTLHTFIRSTRLAGVGLVLAVIAGLLLSTTVVSGAGWSRRISRPTYQQRTVRLTHSRTIQCDVNPGRNLCYHMWGDADLCSRNTRVFPWASFKPIEYSVRTRTSIVGNRVVLSVTYQSRERGGDASRFFSSRNHTLYTAPSGYRIGSVRGPRGFDRWFKYGAHAGLTLLAPSSFARNIGCTQALIKGDSPGHDLRQGYRLMFPITVDLVPSV
jgi:hypothetical protein